MVNEELISVLFQDIIPIGILTGFSLAVTFSLIMYGIGKAFSLLHKI